MAGLFVFIFGLFIGSFLNCVIYRLDVRRPNLDIVRPNRSFCPQCKHILSWLDLIPVFSFLFLRGKCRYCSKKISIQYPLVEILTGLIFFLIFNFLALPAGGQISIFSTIFWLVITSFLIIIFIYDLRHFIIPDTVLFPAIIISIIYHLFSNYQLLMASYLPSAFIASSLFLSIVLISRGKWMGMGDVKLAFLIGLLLGFPKTIVALFFAFLAGAIIGIGLILINKKTLKSEVPFGPFLIAGIYVALFFGKNIIDWYLNLFML